MPSLLFCGPKMAACGIVISIWGVIMLVSRLWVGAPCRNIMASGRIIGIKVVVGRRRDALRGAGRVMHSAFTAVTQTITTSRKDVL